MASIADIDPDLKNDIEQLRSLLNSTDLTLTKFTNSVTKLISQVMVVSKDQAFKQTLTHMMELAPVTRGEFAQFRTSMEFIFALFETDTVN